MAMDPQKIEELTRKVEEATNRELDRVLAEVVSQRLQADRKMLDEVCRAAVQERLASRRSDILARAEAWLDANIDSSIAVAGKAMLDQVLGDLRKRVLGR